MKLISQNLLHSGGKRFMYKKIYMATSILSESIMSYLFIHDVFGDEDTSLEIVCVISVRYFNYITRNPLLNFLITV